MEALARAQRQYHRITPWHGNRAGIRSWCAYDEATPRALSWWDDFQFILSGRRVTVAWCHPRMEYCDEIDARTVDTVDPQTHSLERSIDGARTYKRVGRSRKRLVGIQRRELTAAGQANYEAKEVERRRLYAQGIPHEIIPSMQRTRMDYGIFVSICAPLEVRSAADLIQVADLVRRLLKFETTLAREFPGYAYTQSDWLREAPLRMEDKSA
jgi:hypothetical protein